MLSKNKQENHEIASFEQLSLENFLPPEIMEVIKGVAQTTDVFTVADLLTKSELDWEHLDTKCKESIFSKLSLNEEFLKMFRRFSPTV